MAIRIVLRMGDPLLLEKAQSIMQFNTPELHALINDMQDTMQAMDGAGIAAPQIGVSLQVVIFGVVKNPRYPDANLWRSNACTVHRLHRVLHIIDERM